MSEKAINADSGFKGTDSDVSEKIEESPTRLQDVEDATKDSDNPGSYPSTESSGILPVPLLTSSPLADRTSSMFNCEAEVGMMAYHPVTGQIILQETVLVTDFIRLNAFLMQHGKQLIPPTDLSHMSAYDLKDVNSGSPSELQNKSASLMSSLGSTIPRISNVTIETESSEVLPSEKLRDRKPKEPYMASTKILYDSGPNCATSSIFGRDGSSVISSSLAEGSELLEFSKTKSEIQANEKCNGSTMESSKSGGNMLEVCSSASSSSGKNTDLPMVTKPTILPKIHNSRRLITSDGNHSANTTCQSGLNKDSKPKEESFLEMASTLYTSILTNELVYARWPDRRYYSGKIRNKVLNDAWNIEFDDGTHCVASESHILPIKILGVGLNVTYSPDDKHQGGSAKIIGQKFRSDPMTGLHEVLYAIQIDGETEARLCTRQQIILDEFEAKQLIVECKPSIPKVGGMRKDNILDRPRRP